MYTKHTFSNGLRTVVAPMYDTKSVTVLVLHGVGSRHETKKINGISHFLEHMMFKGTKRRPSTLSISKELDGVGAEYNAYTSKDYTGYYIKIASEHLELALDILSDMLFHSVYVDKEIQREKKVICEELHMYKDNPTMYIDTLLEAEMFSPNSLGWDIGGDDATVMATTREGIVDYKRKHYLPSNTVVGVAGHLEENVLERLEHFFGHTWGEGVKQKSISKFEIPTRRTPALKVQYKETEQAQVALGFYGYGYADPRNYAASLLSVILGGPMSSRLFISVRERLGLAYSIRSSVQSFHETGVLTIQTGLDKARIGKALNVICKEIIKMREKGVTSAELARAKDFIKGQLALRLEGSDSIVSWYVNQELLVGDTLTPDEKLEKIFAVSREDVLKVAREIFQKKHASLAVIGPYKENSMFRKVLGEL
ncbi:MAG: pitrilysin family protein [bacterium]|nr:pitrilysin family protein [bacterium]